MRKYHQQGHPRSGSPPGIKLMLRAAWSISISPTDAPSKSETTVNGSTAMQWLACMVIPIITKAAIIHRVINKQFANDAFRNAGTITDGSSLSDLRSERWIKQRSLTRIAPTFFGAVRILVFILQVGGKHQKRSAVTSGRVPVATRRSIEYTNLLSRLLGRQRQVPLYLAVTIAVEPLPQRRAHS